MQLPGPMQAFVLHFGEMGSRWGINRTVGQTYAVIFLSNKPLCADELVEILGLSRSNIAMALKELQSWDLIRLKHVPGERRDFYVTLEDIWAIVKILVEQRKRREVDPTLTVLRELLMQPASTESELYAQARIHSMHDVIELLTTWYNDVEKLETQRLVQLLGFGSKIVKALDWKDRIFLVDGGRGKTPRNARKAGEGSDA
jgi:DNA-binding transcriptional regulator GbsR (MarR family)